MADGSPGGRPGRDRFGFAKSSTQSSQPSVNDGGGRGESAELVQGIHGGQQIAAPLFQQREAGRELAAEKRVQVGLHRRFVVSANTVNRAAISTRLMASQ